MSPLTHKIAPIIDFEQGLCGVEEESITGQFHRRIIDTREALLAKGLRALGWLPPRRVHELTRRLTDMSMKAKPELAAALIELREWVLTVEE